MFSKRMCLWGISCVSSLPHRILDLSSAQYQSAQNLPDTKSYVCSKTYRALLPFNQRFIAPGSTSRHNFTRSWWAISLCHLVSHGVWAILVNSSSLNYSHGYSQSCRVPSTSHPRRRADSPVFPLSGVACWPGRMKCMCRVQADNTLQARQLMSEHLIPRQVRKGVTVEQKGDVGHIP